MQGSVKVKDWRQEGITWVKSGLSPLTHVNAFVMVDDKTCSRGKIRHRTSRKAVSSSKDGTYTIRLWNDRNPNTDCDVDVYELDFAFNSGNDGRHCEDAHCPSKPDTGKICVTAVSTDTRNPHDNSNWELHGLIVRYNGAEGIFHCLDDWYVHDCLFMRNRDMVVR